MASQGIRSAWRFGCAVLLAAQAAYLATAPRARAQGPDAPSRPNIVLIMADDLGSEVLSSYGGTSYRTPNLDRLAAEGVRFQRAYATPLCTPTRVLLMTGKHNFRNYERFGYLNPAERTFANHLRDAGYATAIAGKWQLSGDADTPQGFGFDEYLLWQLRAPDFWTRYKNPVVTRTGGATDTVPGGYGPDLFAAFVEDFLERHRDGPFLVYYPMVLTHDPFQPSPGHPDFGDLAEKGTNDTTYFATMVAHMDGIVGRIVRKLDQLGLRENTLVIFTGDNGTDRDVVSRMGDRVVQGDKGYTTDAGTHVPLIASWKGVTAPGQVRGDLVDLVDLFPTLLDVAGVEPGPGFLTDGLSLSPTLRAGERHRREWVFRDYDPRWAKLPARRYAQDVRYKLYDDGRLYDYLDDPKEERPMDSDRLPESARRARGTLHVVLDRMLAEKQGVGR